jgi:hypothetical protein
MPPLIFGSKVLQPLNLNVYIVAMIKWITLRKVLVGRLSLKSGYH